MTLNKYFIVTIAVLSSWILSACTVKEERIVEKQAPPDMRESFSEPQTIKTNSVASPCDQASCITIQKAALGKIFLLIASGKTAGSTPQWYDLKPLVVSFEKSGSKMALLAENYNSIYEEIRTVNLVQTFNVISEDDKSITFDWGQGLKSFVLQSSYDVDGARGNNNDLTESSFKSLPVIDSFIRNIKFDEKNIELEQISKIRSDAVRTGKSASLEPREETLAMNIQIRSYNLSADFKKKEYDKSRRVGFFVTKISKKGYSQDVSNLITKWDLSPSKGPIVVRISSAVPADYVEAVKEGAFYWNKVFGRDVVTVKTGVDPQAGPEDRSIFIRWIPWLDSGAAYAIGQSDPLTGEVLRAQVFMPSVFTRVGSADLVNLNGNIPVAQGAIACDLTQSLMDLNKMAREASDSQRLRLAQDSVRATVAHELGHALGLRHNFAGSFSAKVSTKEIYESAKTYLKDLSHQGLETSTSIMDYVSGIDDVLMAGRIKYAALSYDKMAMDWAYSENDSALNEKISLYCTDDDIALATSQSLQIYGCERFDAGNNPLLRKYLDAKGEKENFTKVLFASILGRLYPGDQPAVVADLDTVLQDTQKWGRANFDSLKFVGQAVMDTTKNNSASPNFASIENVKSGQVMYSKMGMDEALTKERARSLAEAGGYAALLNDLWRNADGAIAVNWLSQQIEDLKNSSYIAKGKTLAGREYELTPEQQEKILKFYQGLLAGNRKILSVGVATLLPKFDEPEQDSSGLTSSVTALLPRNLLTDNDAVLLANLYVDLANANEGEQTVKVGPGLTKELKVLKSYLTAEEKAKWMKLLSSKGLRFDMDLKRALIRRSQYEKLNAFLKEIDATLDLSTVKKPGDLASQLLQQGLVDSAASAWLNSEINVLLALDKVL
ncbi:zinc-dependent metalloprotease [Bdellovibrio bacteriovorus]|uniref:zinc-dependent metalloprotease n=1 Tax=Bdellovibrio bacteriovorus TaxID=959 RepID=UPI0035A97B7D